jgi:hypothetical protein
LFEKISYAPEDFFRCNDLISWLRENHFDRVVFSNPYRSEFSRKLYAICRFSGFPFLVIERGSLPGTMFIDDSGFLADSVYFMPAYWDSPLSEAKQSLFQEPFL